MRVPDPGISKCRTQRVHVGIWYILRAQRGSHIPTLRPKYIPYSYMDPLGDFLQGPKIRGHSGKVLLCIQTSVRCKVLGV